MATQAIDVTSSTSNLSLSITDSVFSSGSSMSISSVATSAAPPTAATVASTSVAHDGVGLNDASRGPDGFLEGDVIKLQHKSTCAGAVRCHYSYALYCGNGRVIHSWSNMRTKFRVRVDSLRSLKLAGVTAIDATEEMDTFCATVLDYKPVGSGGEMVARAREALHCETRSRRCSVVLILHARYGGAAMAMVKSLFALAPLVAKFMEHQAAFGPGLSLSSLFGGLLFLMDSKRFPLPTMTSEQSDAPAHSSPFALYKKAAARVQTIKSLLQSEAEAFLAAWIMVTMTKGATGHGRPLGPNPAVPIMLFSNGRLASMIFRTVTKKFAIVFTSDEGVFERLVRDRMECGICFVNLTNVSATLLECAHVICGSCLASLQVRVCPFCRDPIFFERPVTSELKASVNEHIRKNECEQLAANDFDVPEYFAPQATTSGPAASREASQGMAARAAPHAPFLARAPNEDAAMTQLEESEKSKPDMEHHTQTAAGKCRRKYSPEHALFAAGNALRVTKYYQSMGLAGDDDLADDDDDTPVLFVCRLFQCHGVGFCSLRAYEDHYDLLHRNVCRECFRSFLSTRLLDLHISETHDAFFRVLSKRQPMYACLVDGCELMFTHDDKRTRHLVNDHQYPRSFSFHGARRPKQQRQPPAHKTTVTPPNGGHEERDVDAAKIAKAHARKLKRREKKKQEARDRKLAREMVVNDDDAAMDTGDAGVGVGVHDAVMREESDLGELTQRMTQLRMVPKSISFGRRQQRR